MVAWRDAEAALEKATRYWISTTNEDGRPHLIQQWGAWVDGAFYFEGSAETRWARNVARDPRMSVSADNGTVVVILEGRVEIVLRPDRALAEEVATIYARKYARTFHYRPKPDRWDEGGLWAMRPEKAFAWDVKRFGTSLTRFRFDD